MNNVYVRQKKSVKSISLTRILLLIPLILYGFYKNGVYLYINHFCGIKTMFKPLAIIFIGFFIGAIINLFYETIIKKTKSSFIDKIFSSFHPEYGIILACIMPVGINIYIFASVTFIVLFISKFFKNRINVVALMFIIIYIIAHYFDSFIYTNLYEASNNFSYSFFDHLIGRSSGGIASTHVLLIMFSCLILELTNNNKTTLAISSLITITILMFIYSMISPNRFSNLLFLNNYIFILTFISTDYVTSCYSSKGMIFYGVGISVLTFGFYFINPILAPFISISIFSLFNNLIDRKLNK